MTNEPTTTAKSDAASGCTFHHEDAATLNHPAWLPIVACMRANGNAEQLKHIGEQLGLDPQASDSEVAQFLLRVAKFLDAGEVRMEVENRNYS